MRRARFPELAFVLLSAGCGQLGLEPIDAAIDGRLTISPQAATDFGELMPNKEAAMENFVLSPAGEEYPIDVEEAWVEGDTGAFTIAGDPKLPRRLEPGRKMGIRVRFQPKDNGNFVGEFVATTGTGEQVRRQLSGSGCADRDDNHRCD